MSEYYYILTAYCATTQQRIARHTITQGSMEYLQNHMRDFINLYNNAIISITRVPSCINEQQLNITDDK